METHIPEAKLNDPATQQMADVIKTCVHCGFCLPTCPTYLETGSELDSPRGRIMLMKGALEDNLPFDATLAEHIDRCLGCLACVTACPSGVEYNALIDHFRPLLEAEYARPPLDRVTRWLLMEVLPYPGRFRAAAALGRVGRPLAGALPGPFRQMLALLPPGRLPPPEPLPAVSPAEGPRRARVALLTGCVQSVLDPAINAATVRVLTRNGVEVIIPPGQGCCGALANHSGQADAAHRSAGALIDSFAADPAARDVDAIVTNAAGCGSMLKEYAHLLPDRAEQAAAFAGKARDVCEFLADLGLAVSAPIPAQRAPLRIAYHDACHLGHAQGVRSQPRELLRSIPGAQVVELPEAEICCGSAGIYNITQPEMARDLGARKVRNIQSTGAAIVATGNIGCLTQIRSGLAASAETGSGPRIVAHTIQILDWAYAGKLTQISALPAALPGS